MKGVLVVLLLGFVPCYGQKALSSTVEKQVAALTSLYDQAPKDKGAANAQVEQAFFNAFPSSFLQLVTLYGYDDNGDTAVYGPLYASADHLKYFSSLAAVPERDYLEKYFRIAAAGYWQAGNISVFQHGLTIKVLSNIKAFAEVLESKKQKEMRGFFRFLFDGPNPGNPIARLNYEKMKAKFEKLNPDLALVLQEEYQDLVKNSSGTGG